MSKVVKCGLIQCANALDSGESVEKIRTAMIEKHRRVEIGRRARELFYAEEAPHLTKPELQRKTEWLFQTEENICLFAAVLRGEHLLAGFRNANIRRLLHGDSSCPLERRRHSASVGRKLKRLHVRGLLRKVPHTRRWQVTPLGQRLLGTTVRLYYHGLSTVA